MLLLFAALATLNCGDKQNLCVGEEVLLYCNTTNAYLEWNITIDYNGLLFTVFDNYGDQKFFNEFTATLIGKQETSLESNLIFDMRIENNNTDIMCFDGVSGSKATCTILLAEIPKNPDNIQKVQTVFSDVKNVTFKWEPPQYSDGTNVIVDYYEMTVTPPPDTGVCTSGKCNVTGTSITLPGLQCQTCNLTIQPENCAGVGSIYSYSIYSGKKCLSKIKRYS